MNSDNIPCNVFIVEGGDKCSRKKKNGSEFCGYHEKREQLAGPRIPGRCNHIYRGVRCLIPFYDDRRELCKRCSDMIPELIRIRPERWIEPILK